MTEASRRERTAIRDKDKTKRPESEGKSLRRRMSNVVSSITGIGKETQIPQVETPWRIQEAPSAWAVSDDGATLYHMRKGHDVGVLDTVLTKGVTKISFKLIASHNNKGHNIFLGVLDADAPREPPSLGPEKQKRLSSRTGTPGKGGEAWAYHPYDGFLYYTPDVYARGTRAITDSHQELPHMRGETAGQILHLHIDMDKRQLSMSVNDLTPVDISVKLPRAVSPYVLCDWRDDAIEVLGSNVQRVFRQPAHRCSDVKTGKSGKGLLTQRAQALRGGRKPSSGSNGPMNGLGGLEQDQGNAVETDTFLKVDRTPADSSTEALHLEVAIGALLAVHMNDVNAIARALPGFSLGDDPSADLMVKELLRVRKKLDPSLDA